MLIEASLTRSCQLRGLSHAGERYELHALAPGLPTDHFHQLDPVGRRPVEIDERHIRSPLLRRLECGCAIEAASDRVSVAFQQGGKAPGGIRIVIHDEYAATRLGVG